jgi:hypothetical protein
VNLGLVQDYTISKGSMDETEEKKTDGGEMSGE